MQVPRIFRTPNSARKSLTRRLKERSCQRNSIGAKQRTLGTGIGCIGTVAFSPRASCSWNPFVKAFSAAENFRCSRQVAFPSNGNRVARH